MKFGLKNYLDQYSSSNKYNYIYLPLVILVAVILRIIYFNGLVFSDDSYYNQLAYSVLSGEFAQNYIGYPIFLVRKGQVYITSLMMQLFGKGEISTIISPFIISLSGIVLVYKTTLLFLDDRKTALTAALLLALFPPDIIFASINFVDLQCAFIINLGIYLLYKSYLQDKILLAFVAGLMFSLSIIFKGNMLFIVILLGILFVYLALFRRSINKQILISMSTVLVFVIIEGVSYYFTQGNLDYRFTILDANYQYCYYNFFPFTLLGTEYSPGQINSALLKQIFILNPKYLFLRRFYLALPLLGSIQAFISIRKKESKILVYWFVGMIILMLAISTSFTDYKPFDLKNSWYAFIGFMPIIILSARLLMSAKVNLRIILLLAYFGGSIYMSNEYQKFFNIDDVSGLKDFVRSVSGEVIYTDHHTKYGIDVLDNYKENENHRIVIGSGFPIKDIPAGSYLIYNKNVINELKLQGHQFPDFTVLQEINFEEVYTFGEFFIYRKN